ncbi:MAG: hypothetical protein LQ348_006306 [Seirophora lacunosa]|nr:MAG: hypothetical protein LQ348_006306 [Seirophora lacunosa]
MYCIGKKCFLTATVALNRHPIAGSTQTYQLSQPVVIGITLILSVAFLLATVAALWTVYHYLSGQRNRASKTSATDPQETTTDVALPESNGGNAMKPEEPKGWSLAWVQRCWPQDRSLFSDSRALQWLRSQAPTGNAADPPSPGDQESSKRSPSPPESPTSQTVSTANPQQASLGSHSSSSEGPKLPERTENPPSSKPVAPSSTPNPIATASLTPDAPTRSALAKEKSGEELSRKDKKRVHKHKVNAGLKPPPNTYDFDQIAAKIQQGIKPTNGEKKFFKKERHLRKEREQQDGGVPGSLTGNSDAGTASVGPTTDGSVTSDGLIPDGPVVDEPGSGGQNAQ